MQLLNYDIARLAQSSIAASVAISVAAAKSARRSATVWSPPPGYGPLKADHAVYLQRAGFPDDFIEEGEILSAVEGDGFALRVAGVGVLAYDATAPGVYACKTPFNCFTPPVQGPPPKGFALLGDVLYVTVNPLEAILGSLIGIRCLAIALDAWMAPDVPMPLPDDIIHLVQAARPDDRLLNLANGRTVILDRALSTSHLGHALQYHADCRVHLWRGGVAALLPPAKLATVDVETLDTVAEPLPRAFVSYTYDHVAGRPLQYHYPLVYRASDTYVPSVEKDKMQRVKGKNGEEEWVKKRIKLAGVPNCRVRETLIVTKPEAGVISLDRNAGSAQVIEVMEGVTATRREVTWHQQPGDYTTDAFIGRDFTRTQLNQLPDLREMLATKKGQRGHPVVFGTSAKGFFGLRYPDGETQYPAGYIIEDRVVATPGIPVIVPLGAKAGALSCKGTAAAWRQIMRIVLKNSSIASLMGFGASILLHPFVTEVEPGMIVLVGASGRGKTTAMRAIASMISAPSKPSKPGSYIITFRTTDNGLEGRLEARNHSFTLIDEVGSGPAGTDWAGSAYMINNGAGKSRMNADSTMRESKSWMTQTIASGEESMASKMRSKGQAERGGIHFRVVDLHLEGVPFWEHLEAQVQGGATGDYQAICAEFAPDAVTTTQVIDGVFAGLERHHGHAWWEMVERLLDDQYRKMAAERLTAWMKHFTGKLDDRTEIIVHRRSAHLASAMGGLELILDTLGDDLLADERQSIIHGAENWLETYLWRAGLPDGVVTEEGQLVERVLEKITMNPGRFFPMSSDEKRTGFKEYWGVDFGELGVTVFLSGLRDICKEIGEDYQRVRHALISQPDGNRWTEQQRRPARGAKPMRGLESPTGFMLLGSKG